MNYQPTPTDIAFEAFRRNFPLMNVNVSDRNMVYRLHNPQTIKNYESQAKKIIAEMDLPLNAELTRWDIANVMFRANLLITIKSSFYAAD